MALAKLFKEKKAKKKEKEEKKKGGKERKKEKLIFHKGRGSTATFVFNYGDK